MIGSFAYSNFMFLPINVLIVSVSIQYYNTISFLKFSCEISLEIHVSELTATALFIKGSCVPLSRQSLMIRLKIVL